MTKDELRAVSEGDAMTLSSEELFPGAHDQAEAIVEYMKSYRSDNPESTPIDPLVAAMTVLRGVLDAYGPAPYSIQEPMDQILNGMHELMGMLMLVASEAKR